MRRWKTVKEVRFSKEGPSHVVEVKTGRGWQKEDCFRPFLYADTRISDRRIVSAEKGTKTCLWTGEDLELWKLATREPRDVPQVAEAIWRKGGSSFSSDVPYLLNFLVCSGTRVYDGVEALAAAIFDSETVGNKFVLGCFERGRITMDEYRFAGKGIEVFRDPGEVLSVLGEADLVIGHNVSFDYESVTDKEYRKAEGRVQMVFGGGQTRREYVPAVSVFDTVLAARMSLPRAESYSLDMLVQGEGLREERRRTRLTGAEVDRAWRGGHRDLVEAHCIDDVEDTHLLFDHLAPTIFAPAAYAGIQVDEILTSGAKKIWETLLMRRCWQRGVVIPHYPARSYRERVSANPYGQIAESLGGARGGGNVEPREEDRFRVIEGCWSMDVGSQYPSIVVADNVSPETVCPARSEDPDGRVHMVVEFEKGAVPVVVDPEPGMLPGLLGPVIEETNKLKGVPGKERLYVGFKGVRNSAVGFLNMQRGATRFGNPYAFSWVTQRGREILGSIVSILEESGARILMADTDGVLFRPSRGIGYEEASSLGEDVSARLGERFGPSFGPTGTGRLSVEGFDAVYLLKAKNYATLSGEKLTVKGSLLVQRSYPRSSRLAAREILGAELSGNRQKAEAALDRWLDRIWGSDDLADFILTATVRAPGNPTGRSFSTDETQKALVKRKGKRSAYSPSAGYHRALEKQLGPGLHTCYVSEGAARREKPDPRHLVEVADWSIPGDLDRGWAAWHLVHLLRDKLGLGWVPVHVENGQRRLGR